MTTMGDALREATVSLSDAGIESPRLEARLLMAFAHGLSPTQIFSRENDVLDDAVKPAFETVLQERLSGRPLAHITGEREFWSLSFMVTPATLIPRPDTEAVVGLAIERFSKRPSPQKVLDLGTGTGCLVLALLSEFPDAEGCGIDASEDAIHVATENAKRLGLIERCKMLHASWSDFQASDYDLLVANPPYIPRADIDELDAGVRAFEPMGALDGGDDGLDAYRSIFSRAPSFIKNDGIVIVEIGIGQSGDVTAIAEHAGFVAGPIQADIAGIERALSFSKKGVGIAGAKG